MTLRDIIRALSEHADGWPENLDRPIYVRVGREIRTVEAGYVDTGYVLVAGRLVSRS
jgi:hypothetical protein